MPFPCLLHTPDRCKPFLKTFISSHLLPKACLCIHGVRANIPLCLFLFLNNHQKTVVEGASEMLSTFARVWTGVHFDARFAGMVLNIIDSTVSGPSELAAFTVDKVEFGKAAGSPRVLLTVWHYQVILRGCGICRGRSLGFSRVLHTPNLLLCR